MTARDQIAFPKTEYVRLPKLLALARESTCMLAYLKHRHDHDTVVAAHSDSSRHGKGRGIKAHDCFIAFLCFNCHAHVSTLKREKREELFSAAMRSTRNWLWAMQMIKGVTVADIEIDDKWLHGWQHGRIQLTGKK